MVEEKRTFVFRSTRSPAARRAKELKKQKEREKEEKRKKRTKSKPTTTITRQLPKGVVPNINFDKGTITIKGVTVDIEKFNREGAAAFQKPEQPKQITSIQKPKEELKLPPKKGVPTEIIRKGKGLISPPTRDITVRQRIERGLTPKKTDPQSLRAIKGAGTSLFGLVTAPVDLARSLANVRKEDLKKVTLQGVKDTFFAVGADLGEGAQSRDPFKKAKTLTDLGTFVFTPKVSVPKKAQQFIKKGDEIANSISTYQSKVQARSGDSLTNIKTTGILRNNKEFKQSVKLRTRTRDKTVVGTVTTRVKGEKPVTENVSLKDKGAVYEGMIGKEKIKVPKKIVHATDSKVALKEITTRQLGEDVITFDGNIITKTAQRNVEVRKLLQQISEGKKLTKEVVRVSKVELISNLKKAGSAIKPNIDILQTLLRGPTPVGKVITGVGVREKKFATFSFKKFRQSTGLSDKQLQSFLKAIDYDKEIVAGLDRRTRIARALGLRKESPAVKAFELSLKDGVGISKVVEGKFTLKAVEETINPDFFYASFGLMTEPKINTFVSQFPRMTKIQKAKTLNVPKRITVPELKFRSKVVKKIRTKGFISALKANQIIKEIDTEVDALLGKTKAKVSKLKRIPKTQELVKTKAKVKQPLKAKVPKKVVAPKLKKALKQPAKLKTRRVPRRARPVKPKVPAKPPKEIIKPPKIPKLRDLNQKLPAGFNFSFNAKFRERGKVRILKLNTTRNRALNKIVSSVDKSTLASLQLVPVGIVKAKDVSATKALNKFRLRKTKKALELVEKRKFRIDTKGEKQGLLFSKLVKPKLKKKRIKRVKSTIKRKKSPKKTSKRR